MPALVTNIINIIQLAVSGGKAVAEIYVEAKKLWSMLFSGGLITIEQQKTLNDWADAHEAATLAGVVPPELQVDPDPVP